MTDSTDEKKAEPAAKPGTARIFRIRDVSVFVHWSLPLVVLSLALLASVGHEGALVVCFAFLFLTILHELAHTLAARHFGLKVHSVIVSAAGGLCRFEFPRSYVAAFTVVSAGIAAQLLILVASLAYAPLFGEPQSEFGSLTLIVFISANAVMILINLIPEKRPNESFGTDGYLLWKLASRKFKGLPYSFPDTSVTFPPETRLLEVGKFKQEGFSSGIEILNDNVTPMEFVVSVLSNHLNIPRQEAVNLMVSVHIGGGLLVPLPPERADSVAAAITRDAAAAGHPLVCRVAIAGRSGSMSATRPPPQPWSRGKIVAFWLVIGIVIGLAWPWLESRETISDAEIQEARAKAMERYALVLQDQQTPEQAPWFGKTGLPDSVERHVSRYLRLEFGEILFDANSLKAADLEYLGAFNEGDSKVHYWRIPRSNGDKNTYAYVIARLDGSSYQTGWGGRHPPKEQ
jgi:ATP-dependent Clp protease adapter protein ClpS